MRDHSVLLTFIGILLSSTTAEAGGFDIIRPTKSASLTLDKLNNSGPLDECPAIPTPRQEVPDPALSESVGKETCGFFSTGGEYATVTCTGGTGTTGIACQNTGRWLCGGLYTTCLGPTEPVCNGKTENGVRTLCCNTQSPVCGTLLRGSGENQRTGLACFGSEFKTKSIQALATVRWPTFITEPPPPSTTSRPALASAKPCATPTATTLSESSTASMSSTSGLPESSSPLSSTLVTEQPASVGSTQSVIAEVFAALAFVFCAAWVGL
ncbi:hypothetical protein CORC01_10130 [Colletotrichum orchidophilum]|uniref:Uncharacterized protein n=1 Tax=Colletotrichum orchidophilum TaxID=1209926 RepID=A0A1G4AZX1_9PEZI|nr:uncharacterized protein CORC01_10130 [Colletotrichum orchidophilum]OHE94602.1 hypothetical protein CORC01_10130 [Colletotrichum orchidophilum]